MSALPRVALALLSLMATTACSDGSDGPEDPAITSKSQAIANGQRDNVHTSVVGMLVLQGFAGGICSGTLIAPNLVLTAQHCVAETPDGGVICGRHRFGRPYPAVNFGVTTQTDLPFRRNQLSAVREVVVPGENGDICGEDIALLILDEPIFGGVTLPYSPRIEQAPVPGERFTASGYGNTETGDGSGTRRYIENRQVICAEETCEGAPVTTAEWIGDDGTCQGDSGGPALDRDGYVIGVLSRGGDACDFPVYSAVDVWSDWLREHARRAAEIGGYDPPAWVTTGQARPLVDPDGDGIDEREDNCQDLANPDQADRDYDGFGDACDEIDNRDHGGRCALCDGCREDAECPGGYTCYIPTDETVGFCSVPCGDGCADGVCEAVEVNNLSQSVCINENSGFSGICPERFQCGGPRDELADDACRVCDRCTDDAECGPGGQCRDVGAGMLCTFPCGDAECPGDSVCVTVDGDDVCVGSNAGDICPVGWRCEGVVGELPPEETDGGMGGADAGPGEMPVIRRAGGGGGCSMSSVPSSGAWWLLLGLPLVVRRRKR